jgi:glycosyltransferase involved in cell wall biosynthesis
MATVHRLAGTWQHRVTASVALTEFSRDKFIDIELPLKKIFVKPNFVNDRGQGPGDGGYALFVGRLSKEKGVDTILDAWKALSSKIDPKVVGGPDGCRGRGRCHEWQHRVCSVNCLLPGSMN